MSNPRPIDPGAEAAAAPHKRRVVALRAEHSLEELDLELPGDRPIAELLPDILKVLAWPEKRGEHDLVYSLLTEAGDPLSPGDTLEQAGVENSDVLWIRLVAPPGDSGRSRPEPVAGGPAAEGSPAPRPAPGGGPPERHAAPPPPVDASIELAHPSLVSRSGFVFELAEPPLTIGRASSGFEPDLDLSQLDPEFASSRRHCRIDSGRAGLTLTALRTTNGTFVNGAELPAGASHSLLDGDVIQFGLEGVRLSFFGAGTSLPSSFFE